MGQKIKMTIFYSVLYRKGGLTMKKIISMLLSFMMIFTLTIPTFAASYESIEAGQQEKTTIELSDDSYMEIISSINSETRSANGKDSFLIKEFTNNELTHTVEGSYGGEQLLCSDYENGQKVNQKTINIADKVSVSKNSSEQIVTTASYGGVLGRILYNKDIGNNTPGEELIVYSRITNHDLESYTINGALSDTISDITGIVLSILSVFIQPTSIASSIALAIVSYYGGNIAGGAIGVIFTETVAVSATYYTLTGYHAASKYYTAGYNGIARLVKTKTSSAYNKRFYEGYTPQNWKNGDDLATVLWLAVFGRPFPYVYAYR